MQWSEIEKRDKKSLPPDRFDWGIMGGMRRPPAWWPLCLPSDSDFTNYYRFVRIPAISVF